MVNNGITLTNIGEFRSVMREYAAVSKRDDATILNTKGLYIALGALAKTKRADAGKIQSELEALSKTRSTTKTGKIRLRNVTVRRSTGATEYDVPLIALLVNARQGILGRKGLYGKSMKDAIRKFIGSRKRSAAFIASGWIPAIKAFAPLAESIGGRPRRDTAPKQYGVPKGSATVAKESDYVPTAILENFAQSKSPHSSQALERYAGEALRAAFDDEMRSMQAYIEKKKQQTADRYNAR